MKYCFDIAGLPVLAETIPTRSWAGFQAEPKSAAVELTQSRRPFPGRELPAVSSHEELEVRAAPGGWLLSAPAGMAPAQVLLDADKGRVSYHLPPCVRKQEQQRKLEHLLRTAMECRFSQDGIVSLHAACVAVGDWAVAFTGPSGQGKSTRAAAWEEALGAEWISGDRPAIRLTQTGAVACGIPWDGKERIFHHGEKPLRCILEVRRSPNNYLRRLSAEQARHLVARQSFVPMWDTEASVMTLANGRSLVRRVPVYRVFCGPTAQDAREVYDILFHHPEQIREEAKDMKIKDGFVLRSVADEHLVMPTGGNIAKFDGAVVLNDVSAFLFRQLQAPVSREDLLEALLAEYEVDAQTAAKDLDALLDTFEQMGILER